MVLIEKETISEIPVLHIVKEKERENPLPLVIFIHGFTSAKEHNLHYAYLLAEKGFRVVLPEAIHHGERGESSNNNLDIKFWEIVLNTISELEAIKNHYRDQLLIEDDLIGLAGTSMGGIVTLGALTQYSWIKAAVSLMGTPAYVRFAKEQVDYLAEHREIQLPEEDVNKIISSLKNYDLTMQVDKLANRPLLFWHGGADKIVPASHVKHFYPKISSSNTEFIYEEGAGHNVSRDGLKATVNWFETYLKSDK